MCGGAESYKMTVMCDFGFSWSVPSTSIVVNHQGFGALQEVFNFSAYFSIFGQFSTGRLLHTSKQRKISGAAELSERGYR